MSRIGQIIDSYMGHLYPERIGEEFAEWFDAPVESASKQMAMQEQWDSTETSLDKRSLDEAYASTKERISRRNFGTHCRPSLWGRLARVAAVLALPIMAAAATYALLSSTLVEPAQWEEVYAPYGEVRHITLDDGSQITLNAGSRLIYPARFTDKERRIFLAGEAYADIAKDAERKFVVAADDVDITVYGTSFNVRAYAGDSEVEVALVSGSIDMQTKNLMENRTLHMKPGFLAKLDKRTGEISTMRFPNGTFCHGLGGDNLTFINARLSDITAQLERTFNCKIVIDDAALADERYWSVFATGKSLDEVLSALQTNGNMCRRTSGSTIHLYRNM